MGGAKDGHLREIADVLGVTERGAFGIVNDLTEAGYVVEEKDGRRNRYRIENHLPLPAPIDREPSVGELLEVLVDTSATESSGQPGRDDGSRRRNRGAAAQRSSSAKRG
jgi:hypothetical protein